MPFRKLKFFSELRKDERIFLVLREHWIIPLSKAAFWIFFILIMGFLTELLKNAVPFFNEPTPAVILAIVKIVLLMTAGLGLFITWVIYYLSVQIITNERIIDIHQKSLLNHRTAELNLDRFQDVTTEIKGPLANMFDFGIVRVQTAGEMENFVFNNISHPHQTAKIILELYEKIRAGQNLNTSHD